MNGAPTLARRTPQPGASASPYAAPPPPVRTAPDPARALRALALGASLLSLGPGCARPTEPPPDTTPAPAALVAPSVLAVFDVADDSGGLTPAEARQLADYLAARIATLPATRVVPREQLRAALATAKAESYQSCFDESCQLELGKAVSAQKSVATKLLRVGGACALTSVVFDLVTETTDRAASTPTDCAPEALLVGLDELARQLGGAAPSTPDQLEARRVRAASTTRATAPAGAAGGGVTPRSAAPPRAAAPPAPTPSPEPLVLRLDESADARAAAQPHDDQRRDRPSAEAGLLAVVPTTRASTSDAPSSGARPVSPSAPAPRLRWTRRGAQAVVVTLAPILFVEQGDEPDLVAKKVLDTMARAILGDADTSVRFEVVGHASPFERGKPELSERRARSARAYLVSRGVPLSRLGLVAAADRDPLSGMADRFQRRVELRRALEE
jgi:outer membrane protein OmpA-like peptidoglycan-associated protein